MNPSSPKRWAIGQPSPCLLYTSKQAFDTLGVQKLPSVKSLNAQYARLLGEKKAAYAEYRAAREEMRELMVHRKNLSLILQGDAKEGKGKEAEWEGR